MADDVVGAGWVFGVPPENAFGNLHGQIVVRAQPRQIGGSFCELICEFIAWCIFVAGKVQQAQYAVQGFHLLSDGLR